MNFVGTLVETPLDCIDPGDSHLKDNCPRTSTNGMDQSSIIQREIAKYMKGKESSGQALFAQTSFASIFSTLVLSCSMNSSDLQLERSSWIIDTGASNHMCHALNMFDEVTNKNLPYQSIFQMIALIWFIKWVE